MNPLPTTDGELFTGIIVDRPNRLVARARFEDTPERVFLRDPGAPEGTVEPGDEILCLPVDDPERVMDYDAITVRVDGVCMSVRPTLANDLFERVLARDTIPAFVGYGCLKREPVLPEHGWTDFFVETPADETAFVEIKSCVHVKDGVAMFSDRQAECGWRHPRGLEAPSEDGHEIHVVFVVQRPDAERFRPYRAVDPEFVDSPTRVQEIGVGVHAIMTSLDPPHCSPQNDSLPVDMG